MGWEWCQYLIIRLRSHWCLYLPIETPFCNPSKWYQSWGSDQGFLIKGGKWAIWHTNQNQCPLKRVEFMCGEMLSNLRDMCESWFVTCAWRKCSTAYIFALVVASSGLQCLIMLDLHGERGARDVQWWCFAWLMWCFINSVTSLCCGSVVAWPRWRYDGFPLSISELLVTMMWKLPTTSLMCKAVMVDDRERLSSLVSPFRSPVTRVIQADLLDH